MVCTTIFTGVKHTIWWNEGIGSCIIAPSGTKVRNALPLGSTLPWKTPLGMRPMEEERVLQEQQEESLYKDVCDRLSLSERGF